MATPWRAVELAGDAPFHADRDAVDLNVSIERSTEVIVAVLVEGIIAADINAVGQRLMMECFIQGKTN